MPRCAFAVHLSRYGPAGIVLALALGLSVLAQTLTTQVEIAPPNPTPDDNISIRVFGAWGDSCIPGHPLVSISDRLIRIETSNPGQICLTVLTDWSLTVPVGKLTAGNYEVAVTHSAAGRPPVEIARKTFTVAGQPPLEEVILPIVANGIVSQPLHFQTTFTLLNLAGSGVQANLQVYDDKGASGSVFCVPVGPADRTSPVLNPNGEFHVSTSANARLTSGWARLTWRAPGAIQSAAEVSLVNAPPVPCLVICNRPSTEIVAGAQVPAVRPAREFRAAVTITRHRHTALALVNPSQTEKAIVRLALLDSSGQPFLLSGNPLTRVLEIPPLSRISAVVWDALTTCLPFQICVAPALTPPPQPKMFHGSVKVSSDILIAVGALNVLLPEGRFINIPVSSQ